MIEKLRKAKAALAMAAGAALSISTSAEVHAAGPASDVSTNAPYAAEAGGAWKGTNSSSGENPYGTDNGGSGFGAWSFGGGYQDVNTSPNGNLNHYIDGVDLTHSTYNDLGSSAFALTTSNTPGTTAAASRSFLSPMQVGDTFTSRFDTPALYDGNANPDPFNWFPFAIMEMQNAAGQQTFNVEAGSSSAFGDFNWDYTDATGNKVAMSPAVVPTATSDGSTFKFQLTSLTTGTLTFDLGGPDQHVINISLKAGPPSRMAYVLFDAGSDTDGQREFFFDNLAITNTTPINQWKKSGTNAGNWSATSHWTNGAVPDGADAYANFFADPSLDGPVTVTLDTNRVVGSLNFDNGSRNFAVVGTSTLTLTTTVGVPSINIGSGTHTVSAPVVLTANTPINAGIVGGSLTMTNLQPAAITLTKNGPGTFSANAYRVNNLVINTGTARVVPNSFASGVSVLPTFTVNASGHAKLDLTNNKLVTKLAAGTFNGSTYTGVTGRIVSGRGTGNLWDGDTGIITSQTQAIGSNYTSIGVAQASDVRPNTATETALWAGQTITGTDTLVMYTYGGDATLDGKINIDDYVKIDSGISANLTGWSNGDFNYDGKINIDDYTTVIDANIGNQTGTFFTAGAADGGPAGVSAIPEPASLSLIALAAAAALGRCRRPS